MRSNVLTHPGRLFLLVLLTAATVLASVEQVVAHAGNTSPSVIHACVNRTNGNTRIVGLTGVCTSAEDPIHWGIVGPQGPQGPAGPAGIVASFDNLAGLACTLNGTVGTVAILYATNGDATLRCVVAQSQPPSPPAAGIAGTYDVSPVIHFECVFGLAQFTVTGFVFTPSTSGSTLTVTPIGLQDRDMTGVINGNHFSVQVSSEFTGPFGNVNDSYTLDGEFQPDGTWTGTFQAFFSGGGAELFGCTGQAYPNLVGTHQ